MSMKGTRRPHCFLIKPSRQANSVIIETIDQKTSVCTQKTSNSPGKCYKPISYSIDIQCCIIGHWLLLAKHVICLSLRGGCDMHHFYWFGLDFPTIFGLYNCDRYLSYRGYHWFMPSFWMWLLFFSSRGMNHNWIKSETWQSPPTRGTFLYHIW